MNVAIDQAQNDGRNSRAGERRSAQICVPIDGDMREYVDVDVIATATIEGSGDDVRATYTATLTNTGTLAAENITVMFALPKQAHFLRTTRTAVASSPALSRAAT